MEVAGIRLVPEFAAHPLVGHNRERPPYRFDALPAGEYVLIPRDRIGRPLVRALVPPGEETRVRLAASGFDGIR